MNWQVVSFVSRVTWGLAIGLVLSALQLIDTAIEPLAEDTPGLMIGIVSALILLWIAASYVATRRTDRYLDAVVSGLLVGLATMAVLHVSAVVRVNLFLDEIQYRDDWVNLMARFHASRFQSLRAYANYEYLSGLPLLLMLGAGVGALCGSLSGAIHKTLRAS